MKSIREASDSVVERCILKPTTLSTTRILRNTAILCTILKALNAQLSFNS